MIMQNALYPSYKASFGAEKRKAGSMWKMWANGRWTAV